MCAKVHVKYRRHIVDMSPILLIMKVIRADMVRVAPTVQMMECIEWLGAMAHRGVVVD